MVCFLVGHFNNQKDYVTTVRDAIQKVDGPGLAWCNWCATDIKYGKKGITALKNHIGNTEKHREELAAHVINKTLGSFGQNVSISYI